MNVDEVVRRLIRSEGNIPHMYRCTGGRVTVGIGHAIKGEDEAVRLPFVDSSGAKAAEVAVREGYRRVQGAPSDLKAQAYAQFTHLVLAGADIDTLLRSDIDEFVSGIRAEYPEWDSWPERVQEAVFDMIFNCGPAGFRKFKRLIAALKALDWATAAAECHRQGISEGRNAETAALFRAAAGLPSAVTIG